MIVKMIEPITISFGLYIISSPPIQNFNRNHLYLKKKFCRWSKKHKEAILDIVLDEGSELVLDNTINHINSINYIINKFNHISIIKFTNPTIYFILYCVLILYVIIF